MATNISPVSDDIRIVGAATKSAGNVFLYVILFTSPFCTRSRLRSVMHHNILRVALGILLLSQIDGLRAESPESRRVRIEYGFEAKGLPPGQNLRIWCPVPSPSAFQEVTLLAGDEWSIHSDPSNGNRYAFQEIRTGQGQKTGFAFEVKRQEVTRDSLRPVAADSDAKNLNLWLRPNRLVPVTGSHQQLLSDLPIAKNEFEQARQLYDLVLNHVDYRKDKPGWGRGDTAWVCDSRFGNCTDFHSLFISLARARRIPARFEIGFTLPNNTMSGELNGYHCWAWFYSKQLGWVPVDISEADKAPDLSEYFFANLTANRVAMSIGRDLTLVPPQKGPPLNFFIAPYAELNGEPVSRESFQLKHTWRDMEGASPSVEISPEAATGINGK